MKYILKVIFAFLALVLVTTANAQNCQTTNQTFQAKVGVGSCNTPTNPLMVTGTTSLDPVRLIGNKPAALTAVTGVLTIDANGYVKTTATSAFATATQDTRLNNPRITGLNDNIITFDIINATTLAVLGTTSVTLTNELKDATIAGRVITFTKSDGTTFTITLPNDTNTAFTSVGNTLSITDGGGTLTAPSVNTVSNTFNGANGQLTTTVNGVVSTPVVVNPPTTNTLTNPLNTITSTVDGVIATAPAVNTVTNNFNTVTRELTTTVNGVIGAVTIPNADFCEQVQTVPLGTYNPSMKVLSYDSGGSSVPAGWVGYDFDIPNDFPGATNATDLYLHIININISYFVPPATNNPTTPVVATDVVTIQSFLNTVLVTEGFAANDLVWVVNGDNTITVWANPAYPINGSEFWAGIAVPDNYVNKLFPTIPTTHAAPLGTCALVELPQNDWTLTGNVGTTAGTNFVGTTDNTTLEFRTNNVSMGLLGTNGSVRFGDGTNTASGGYATNSGGTNNIVSGWTSTNGGGDDNIVSNDYATNGGGTTNRVTGFYATNSGGTRNTAPSYGEWTGGLFNKPYTPISATTWEANDYIFRVGNGQGTGLESDALTITKGGTVAIPALPNAATIGTDANGNLVAVTPSNDWTLTGNTGTTAVTDGGTNFVGTTDAANLEFRVNNTRAGFLDHVNNTVIFGHGATAAGATSNSIGRISTASGAQSNAIGNFATASGLRSNSIGFASTASASGSIAIGWSSNATAIQSISLGQSSAASGTAALSIGTSAIASNTNTTAVGFAANATDVNATALGTQSMATSDRTVALGVTAMASGSRSIAIGSTPTASGAQSNAIGNFATASGLRSNSIGFASTASASGSIAIGWSSNATAIQSISLGQSSAASGTAALSIGTSAIASNTNTTAVGFAANATNVNATALGTQSMATSDRTVALGVTAMASGSRSIAIGSTPTASGVQSTAIGNVARSSSFQEVSFNETSAYTPVSTTGYNAADRLFNVGVRNGLVLNDAFTILKNAQTGIGYTNFEAVTNRQTLDVNGTARIVTTPTITTATKVLVKDPATGQISEQAIAATLINKYDEFTSTAAQTAFTLTGTPTAGSTVVMFRNGVSQSKTTYTVTGTAVTYSGGALAVGDRINFQYIQ